jgi:hypothetical protein
MSYHATDHPDIAQPWFSRTTTWVMVASCFFLLMILGLSSITYGHVRKISDIGGAFTIKAHPDAKIYIGDEQVGTGQVAYSWVQLLGDEKNEPVAIEQHDLKAAVTPEFLAGPGAEVLKVERMNAADANYTFMTISDKSFLIRRADGSLDQIIVLVFDWKPVNQSARRFILPVRIRKTSFFYSNGGGSSTFVAGNLLDKMIGRPRVNISDDCIFSSDPPPVKFAEEIKAKGLWEPGHE